MTTINTNRPVNPAAAGSTAATTATSATSATATPAAATATATPTAPELASAAATAPLPVTPVTGLGAGKSFSVVAPTAGQNVSLAYANNPGVLQASGGYTRGKIEVAARAVDDKHFAVDVKTMHAGSLQGNDDPITLVLQARIQDGTKEGVVNLAMLKDNAPLNNVGKHDGLHTFKFAYDDVDAYLKTLNPNLKLVPGARLAVAALWGNNHQWGGFGRMGDFEVPTPHKRLSPTATRLQGVTQAAAPSAAASLPLDITYEMPQSIASKSPNLFGPKVEVTSRLETELKGLLGSEGENEAAIVRLYQLANDPGALKKALGDGYTLSPHTEWWQKDDQGKFKDSARMAQYRDPAKLLSSGLAKTQAEADALAKTFQGLTFGDPLPLEDKYKGNKGEMRESVIQRVRSNAIAEGVFNLKPGPGALAADVDPRQANLPSGLVRKRIEYGFVIKDKNVDRNQLDQWLRTDKSPYNPAGQALRDLGVTEAVSGGSTRYAGQTAYIDGYKAGLDTSPVQFDMNQERHRFTLEHAGGLSIDISVDFVEVNGKKYQFVEMEIDHLYFGQGNKAQGAVAAESVQIFSDDQSQQTWAQGLSAASTLNVPPRFHELRDLKDPGIWQTAEQKETEKLINQIFPILYPNGATSAQQKGVHIATDQGLI